MSTRNLTINLLFTLVFLLGIDLYLDWALRTKKGSLKFRKGLRLGFWLLNLVFYAGFFTFYAVFTNRPLESSLGPNLLMGFFFSYFIFKLLLLFVFLAEDLVRLLRWAIQSIGGLTLSKKVAIDNTRRNFVRNSALVIAGIPFGSMLFGITKGKYLYRLHHQVLTFDNLPKAFDGLRVVQISDIHSGSFDSREDLRRGIEMINAQAPDLILFTGDLVNNDSREIAPYLEDFKVLKAKHGVYSVLGNHDYGDYKKWPSQADKEENQLLLHSYQEQMGFKLLNNEHVLIEEQGQKFGLFGVENWGRPPFPQRGDLNKALKGAEDIDFKILMSHDPTHWDLEVCAHPVHFDLTLSGHTHGMQFGVEIPGIKWSPVEYLYKQWAGLYERDAQYLYVNRGFGFIGFPGRVGIWPEITLLELKSTAS